MKDESDQICEGIADLDCTQCNLFPPSSFLLSKRREDDGQTVAESDSGVDRAAGDHYGRGGMDGDPGGADGFQHLRNRAAGGVSSRDSRADLLAAFRSRQSLRNASDHRIEPGSFSSE